MHWKKIGLVSLAILLAVVEGLQVWWLYSLTHRLQEAEWTAALHSHNDDDVISVDVGTIQFLKTSRYSIELEDARYTADGLVLKGYVGNPTNLWINNLTLKFYATKQLWEFRKTFDADNVSFFWGPEAIGQVQSQPIPILAGGTRQPFEVTIPNVKQTKDGIRLVVSFSGERYSYSR